MSSRAVERRTVAHPPGLQIVLQQWVCYLAYGNAVESIDIDLVAVVGTKFSGVVAENVVRLFARDGVACNGNPLAMISTSEDSTPPLTVSI